MCGDLCPAAALGATARGRAAPCAVCGVAASGSRPLPRRSHTTARPWRRQECESRTGTPGTDTMPPPPPLPPPPPPPPPLLGRLCRRPWAVSTPGAGHGDPNLSGTRSCGRYREAHIGPDLERTAGRETRAVQHGPRRPPARRAASTGGVCVRVQPATVALRATALGLAQRDADAAGAVSAPRLGRMNVRPPPIHMQTQAASVGQRLTVRPSYE